MKVDNPTFGKNSGAVVCIECPFADVHGTLNTRGLCSGWEWDHDDECPTAETYQEACELAEKAVQ